MDDADRLTLPAIARDKDFAQMIRKCDSILETKGRDYTQGDSGDYGRLKNFFVNADRLGLTPRQVLGVYLNKHIDAVQTFLRHGAVESEPIEGRIADVINYCLLLHKLIQVESRAAGSGKE